MRQRLLRLALSTALVGSLVGATAGAALAVGEETITVPINDSEAGGTYDVDFERVFAGTTGDGTPVYIYVPEGAIADESVDWIDPSFDPNPDDDFEPCPSKFAEGQYIVIQ